ncbi:hypothetical protein [Streptomyces sp. NPDC003863]
MTGKARWNDETQSWETGEPGTAGTAPAPAWSAGAPAPVVPQGGATAGPVVPEAGAAPGPVVPESGEAAGPVVPQGGEASDPVLPWPGRTAGPVVPDGGATAGPAFARPGSAAGAVAPPPPPPGYAPEFVHDSHGWQYPAPPVPAARPRPWGVLVAGVAGAVVVGGAVAGWMVWGGGGKSPAAGPPASVSATATATATVTESPDQTPSETPSPSDTPLDDVPPPGYRAQQDLKGFTIAVPEGWNRTENEQGVFYNAPDGRSLIQVFVIEGAGMTPYDALRGASEDGRTNKPGYSEISLGRVSGEAGAPADSAELVYAYDREGGRRKVVDRAFTAPDGNQYAILAAGPETDWPEQRERLRVALEFFRPGDY